MSRKMSSSYSLAIERYLQDTSGFAALPPSSYPYRHPHPHSNHQMHTPAPSRSTGIGERGSRRDQERPRLLLMGQRRFEIPVRDFMEGCADVKIRDRSGKSSISSVVFHKMPPTETLFLESTTRITKDPIQ